MFLGKNGWMKNKIKNYKEARKYDIYIYNMPNCKGKYLKYLMQSTLCKMQSSYFVCLYECKKTTITRLKFQCILFWAEN